MLVQISEDRFVNPLSDNIIGIFPPERRCRYPYVLHIGCADGIVTYFITKEDRDLIVKAMRDGR